MPDLRRQSIPLVLGLLFLFGSSPLSSRQISALERYAAGEFDAAVGAMVAGRSIGKASADLKRDARKWIDQAAPAIKPGRWNAVAALAVELMAESLERDIHEYRDARLLIEWVCSELRRQPVSDFERQFHRASIALMQGSREEGLWSGLHVEDHAEHAIKRFPDEGMFKLAYITRRLPTQWVATWPLAPGYVFGEKPTAWGEDPYLNETGRDLATLFGDPAVGDEARLRSGVLSFLYGKRDEARTNLTGAAESSDAAVRYVAQLMLGAIEDQANRSNEAIEHYRAAHRSVAASASSVALAGALYRSGQASEAAEVLRAYDASLPPPDPWRLYSQRDYRRYPEFRSAMRKTVQPAAVAQASDREDSSISEAGAPLQASASSGRGPLDVSVVVQEYRRRRFETVETFDTEVQVIADSLGPADRLRVRFAGDDQRELTLPLRRSLDRSAFRNEVCVPVYDAVARALMKPVEPGRSHVVILIATSEGTGSVLSAETVADIARRSSAQLQVVAVDERNVSFGRYDVAAPRCTAAVANWSPERQARLKHIQRNPQWDDADRELWLEQRRHLVGLAKLTGGGEIEPTLLRASRTGPLREAIEDLRGGRAR
jgi:hypothetical protein